MSAAALRVWPAALLILAWSGCEDVGTVGESTAQAVAGTGGAGTSDSSAGSGAVSTIDAGDDDEDDEDEDEAAEDEGCETLPLQLLGLPFPDSLCAACDTATPCADELECIDSQCSQCEDNDECGEDASCDHGVCIPEDAEEADP